MPMMIEYMYAKLERVVKEARTGYAEDGVGKILDRGKGWVLLDDNVDNVTMRYDGRTGVFEFVQIGYEL
ncbi:MAG: hypothetical protein KIT42_05155 [Rhodocyclaceae bacterium]|nr:hypothetical protein [Rhodocyclaceae bacterium]